MVRHVLTGIAGLVSLPGRLIDDIKTAVSEACANVVLHAYRGESGPLRVTIGVDASGLTVIVRDSGEGIKPRRGEDEQRVRGVGLSLIQTLTDSVEFRGAPRQGTEVRMNFRFDGDGELVADGGELSEEELEELQPDIEGETVVEVSPGLLAAPVLAAVIAVLAARASFSVERLADAQLVTDTIAAHSDSMLVGPYLTMAIDSADSELDLRLGPLQSGDAMRLVGATEVGDIKPLQVLADEVGASPAARDEYLRVRLRA